MKKKKESIDKSSTRPMSTPEAREQRMVSLAMDLAEQQLIEGTASPSVITHFLKLGCSINELEKEKIEKENILLNAKAEALESAKRVEELYSDALKAFSDYKGDDD